MSSTPQMDDHTIDEQAASAETLPYVEEPDWLDRAVAYVKPRRWIWISALVVAVLILVTIVRSVNGTVPLGTDPTTAGHPLSNPDQHLHSMALDPTHPGVVYLGSHYGVFTSTDDGKSWPQPRGELNTLMITSLSVSHLAQGTLGLVGVAAIGNDVGVFITHNDGAVWQRTSVPKGVPADQQAYLILAGASAHQWFTIYTTNGLYVTNDDGHSWQLLHAPISTQEDLHALWQSSANPQVMLLGSNLGLYVTTNGGTSWQTISGIIGVHAIASSSASPAAVFVSADAGVYHSADNGGTYILMSGLVAQGPFSTLVLSQQRASVLYGLAGNEVWRSGDGGATWVQQKILETASPSALLVAPNNDQHLYAGFYAPADAVESLDGGLSWHVIAS